MKKIFLFLCLHLFFIEAFSLSFGFQFDQDIIKISESEDFILSPDLSVFSSANFSFGNYFLSVKPSVRFNNQKIKFQFIEFKNSFVFDFFAFSAGKNNFYFGKPIIQNIFFPNIQETNLSKKNLWNLKLDFFYKKFNIFGGMIFDTTSLDNFEKPNWWNFYASLIYSNQFIDFGFESDCLFLRENTKKIKFSSEISVYTFSDFIIYGDFSFLNSDFSGLLGFQKNHYYENFGYTFIFENGFLEKNYCYSVCFIPEIFTFSSICLKFEHHLNKNLYFLANFSFSYDDFELYFEYQSPNFIKNNNQYRISVGIKNER